jgi:hypothetical protein
MTAKWGLCDESLRSKRNINRALICKPFKEPRNRFPASWAGTTTLFVVPACQATYCRLAESIPELHKCLQIRAQDCFRIEKVKSLFSIWHIEHNVQCIVLYRPSARLLWWFCGEINLVTPALYASSQFRKDKKREAHNASISAYTLYI